MDCITTNTAYRDAGGHKLFKISYLAKGIRDHKSERLLERTLGKAPGISDIAVTLYLVGN